jgi:cell division protein FtsB
MGYKKIAFFVVLTLLLFAINNLAHSIYSTWEKQDLILKAQQDLEAAKLENQELRKDLAFVRKPEFVETEARDKLLLAKPGEGIIVIPTNGVIATPSVIPTPPDTRPNYQRWWEVFF